MCKQFHHIISFNAPKVSYAFGVFCLATAYLMLTACCHASSYLLYLEAQGVGGYSRQEGKDIWYSKTAEDVMQKPSVGFDYIRKLSGDFGDFGAVAIQARMSYDDKENILEPQLYNAYIKGKYRGADIWMGHNRPALGLSSYFDTHALLLTTLSMNGFGFDRDWGIGTYRDFSWGNAAISLTTGSGMPIYFKGNYLASARISKGSLNQDNYNLGFSLAYGETLTTMGYDLMRSSTTADSDPMTDSHSTGSHSVTDADSEADRSPKLFAMAGADVAYLWDNFEARCEVMGGKNKDEEAFALFGRFGVNLLDESRLKLEFQPIISKVGDDENFEISAGASYMLTGDITLRAMYDYDHNTDDHKIIFQLYYYKKL
ncbi:MAG: hypothetical protein BWK80_18820 [Desulfobacteraceae bacterium IS3]|nr:MAG: hypothetical protein BWK80_18820 [Desulfobacteraceae bacterium IS3]